MATRAEMQEEVKALRAEMAELEKIVAAKDNTNTTPPPDAAGSSGSEATASVKETASSTGQPLDSEPSSAGSEQVLEDARAEITRVLEDYGLKPDEIEDMVKQVWQELESLPKTHPMVTIIGAFAMGFLVGRITK